LVLVTIEIRQFVIIIRNKLLIKKDYSLRDIELCTVFYSSLITHPHGAIK